MTRPGSSRLLAGYSFVICCLSPAAVLVILIESLTSADFVSFPPAGLSLRWYMQIPHRPEFIDSLTISLVVAALATVLSSLIGTMAALALMRYRLPGKAALQILFLSPLSVPAIVLGIALLQFYATYRIPRGTVTLVFAHALITSPYTIRLVSVSLAGVDRNLELAARNLGAGPLTTFRRITVPLIRPGLVAGAVFAFIVSFDEISMTLFLASSTTMTLPVRIYTYIDQSYDPFITAISSILVLITVVLAIVIERTVGIGKLFGMR